MFFQRAAVARQARFTRWGMHRHGQAGDIAMPLGNQIVDGLKRRFLLFKEHAAFPRLANIAIDHHQRRFNGFDKRHDFLFAHMAGVEHDGVTLTVGQHLHRFFFPLGRIVAIGDDKLLAPGFRLTRGLLQ